ncbi:unconventional myosin-Ia-like [Rhopilema esculentum]|uniref:unconventional myosin-Ia-like n=2 Tax=Rhopilema esculentum TaxID=499914 RepID=UPI0031D542B2
MDNQVGVSDMVLLDPLTEDALVENLKIRFKENKIYTYIGDVVVSINPYKGIPIYGTKYIEDYRSRNMYEMPPHVFSLADDAYRSMRDYHVDQCIIISGESGSGKTEASKIVMRYVAAVSGKGEDVNRLKEQLLQSNPVLEAFGNAKTIRNDNSSRFGKYMDLEFDYKGDPIGGFISNYLLEKSRVVHQTQGERNFHIFYELLLGAPDIVMETLGLKRKFDDYSYLNQSNCTSVPSINDAENFKIVESAMKLIGFSTDEIAGLYTLLGGILHLGNVLFRDVFVDGVDTVDVLNENDAEQAANLFGCAPKLLMDTLCTRSVESGKEKVVTRLSPANANYGRDALCKAIYNRLFDWIVAKINNSVQAPKRAFDKKVIGVLDIYGFEVFKSNAFEQFIINYCNEKLQQLFIELTLKSEQEEYVREGVEWIHIDYFNNAIICDLIEKQNTGILALLDEECLRPGDVTDKTFLEKLNNRCINHAHFDSRVKSRSDTSIDHDCFKLKHYAGDVTYDVNNFIDKNNDPLYRDMSVAMYNCSHLLLKDMFPEGNPSYKNKKRPPTVGTQMKVSVAELVKNMSSKQPHYIRCIKPNDTKSAVQFTEQIVRHESRYLGLLENIRVRRAGYCFRQRYELFLERYKMLSDATWPNWKNGPAKDGVKNILDAFNIRSPDCEYGKSKLFIRDPRTVFLLEDQRKRRIVDLVVLLQKTVRGWVARHKFQKMKASEIKIASFYKMHRERKKYIHFKTSVIFIQAVLRGYKARKANAKFLKKHAGPKIIKYIRKCLAVKFLINIYNNQPSASPLDTSWPNCLKMFTDASDLLYKVHHAWRCHQYREKIDPERKRILSEKSQARDIFGGKKETYAESVPIPFEGDHLKISDSAAWAKQKTKLSNDLKVVFTDNILKTHRKNGKEVPKTLLLSCCELLILEPKSLQPVYTVGLTDIVKVTTTPLADGFVIIHVKQGQDVKSLKKGDFMLRCDHVIELVAKTALAYKKQFKRELKVDIAESFSVSFNGRPVTAELINGKLSVKKH